MVALIKGVSPCPPLFLPEWTAWSIPSPHEGDALPRVNDNVLDAVAFLYRSGDDAEKHVKSGGTCFLIGVPIIIDGKETGHYAPYMVSNRHVVWSGGCPVIRLNRFDGGPPDIIEAECDQWAVHPDGDDVAIVSVLGALHLGVHKVRQSPLRNLLTQQIAEEYEVGIGDDVVMMGRFVNHQGRVHNEPAVRFGNISAPLRPIWNRAINRDQISYAVEMRSRTGFSGSPVTVYRAAGTALTDVRVPQFNGMVLGINWGYINDEDGENTWLNGVVPAWKILETLEAPALKKMQEAATRLFVELSKDEDGAVPAVSLVEDHPPSDANPTHREDFTALLNAAAKTPPQAD
jgi:hypothetical protein